MLPNYLAWKCLIFMTCCGCHLGSLEGNGIYSRPRCVNKTQNGSFYVLRRSRSNTYYCHGRTIQFWFEIHFGLWFISLFILIADIEHYGVMTLKLSFIALLSHFVKISEQNVAKMFLSCTCSFSNCKSGVHKVQMKGIPYCKFVFFSITARKI